MTAAAQPITTEQLAQLYEAANQANSNLDAARRAKPRDPDAIEQALQRSRALNSSYDTARRRYKKQQKADGRKQWRSTMIRFYLDCRESQIQANPT